MFRYDRVKIKGIAKSRIPSLYQKRYLVLIGFASLALIFLLSLSFIKMAVVMSVLIVLGVGSLMYNRFVRVSLGFELILFGCVVAANVYGFFQGLIVGWVSLFFAEVLTGRLTYSTAVSFAGLLVVSAAASVLDMNIVALGILMVFLYDFVIAPGYLVMGSSLWRTLLFVGTHIMFNAWLFFFVAPKVLPLVSGME